METSRDTKPSKVGDIPLSPGLYLVATPIGNAADIGLRAISVLGAVDLIACEDTRITAKLLSIHNIKGSLFPYHDHNGPQARPRLLEILSSGGSVALVSDAGTPAISDPGYKLVRACIDENIAVTSVPGASSSLSALIISGLPTDRFYFAGFLPNRRSGRQRELENMKAIPGSLIIQESAKRLAVSLSDMTAVLGDRPAAVTRELTKRFEEVRRGTLSELAAHFAESGPPKGEVVVVVGGPEALGPVELASLDEAIIERLNTASARDIARDIAEETGMPRREIYNHIQAVVKRSDRSD